jgi:hypothetical protein
LIIQLTSSELQVNIKSIFTKWIYSLVNFRYFFVIYLGYDAIWNILFSFKSQMAFLYVLGINTF